MTRPLTLFFALAFVVCPRQAIGQSHSHNEIDSAEPGVRALGETARLESRRFVDLRVAITEGYHKVGPDFPGMGEHWVHFGRLLGNGMDPAMPAVLTYLPVGGERLFTGIAFAKPALRESDLENVPLPDAWHFHSGTIDEETLFLNPAPMTHGHTRGAKLAMLHLWIGVENPAGLVEQDNWALPFIRVGIEPPPHVSPKAGKALFLLTGGLDYYERLIRLVAELSPDELARVRNVLRGGHDEVRRIVSDCLHGTPVAESHLLRLSDAWDHFWAGVRESVGESAWSDVEMLSG